MRLFFALWPDEDTRTRLSMVLDSWPVVGRRVPGDTLHCTLAFLRGVSAETQTAVTAAASGLDLPVFDFTLCTAGFWARPKIAWLGTEGTPPGMRALVEALAAVARKYDIRLDERPFKPRIMAFRMVRWGPDVGAPFTIRWRAGAFTLVESVTEPSGVRYRPLQQSPLQEDR